MDLSQFHFLRPVWLLAFLPWLLLLISLWRHRSHAGIWEKIIDPRLRPYVLMGTALAKRHPLMLGLSAVMTALLIVAQAGPVWEKRPQPLFKPQSALVIALDLSRSMDAPDLRPSRLAHARFKLNDILDQRKTGQTALLVWAASPFTVTPLTDDVQTIRALLPSLSTDMMPAQGGRADRAIKKAVELMKNAGQSRGDILLISDGAGGDADSAARHAHEQGYHVSVLATGTTEGAPIPLAGGDFLKNSNGGIVIPKLDIHRLQQLAQQGGGRFSLLSTDDRDIHYLLAPINKQQLNQSGQKSKLNTDAWYEQGPWLILFTLPLAALLFRRGEIFLLLIFLLPVPQPAQAFEWQDLWLNPDQQGEKLLQKNQPKAAAEKFEHPQWKAAAEYRAGLYQQAINDLQSIDTAESWYNRGNALAKAGQLQEAVHAYEQALKKAPEHEDAKYNKKLIEDALKKQQQNQPSDSNSDKPQKSDQAQSQNQDSQNKDSQKQDSKQDSQKQNAQDNKSASQKSDEQDSAAEQQQDKSTANAAKENESAEDKNDAQQAEKDQAETKDEAQNLKPEQNNEKPLTEEQRATQQWLRRIPDDPGGLLRRKFRYQYQQQPQNSPEPQTW